MIEEVCLSLAYLVEESYGPEASATMNDPLFRKMQKGRTVGNQEREGPTQNLNLGGHRPLRPSPLKRKCIWGN